MSLPDDPRTTTVERDDRDWYEPVEEDLPPRPRRRLVTPVTLAFAAIIVGAGGFFAGVEVQKNQGTTTGGAALAGAATGFPGRGGAGAAGGGSGGPVAVGTVASKKGRTLYVSAGSGATIKVKVDPNAKVSRTATTGSKGIYPGDTVVVQGTKGKDGSVSATRVSATAKGASTGGFGGGGRPPGFTPPGG
jgi:hypothetical protein